MKCRWNCTRGLNLAWAIHQRSRYCAKTKGSKTCVISADVSRKRARPEASGQFDSARCLAWRGERYQVDRPHCPTHSVLGGSWIVHCDLWRSKGGPFDQGSSNRTPTTSRAWVSLGNPSEPSRLKTSAGAVPSGFRLSNMAIRSKRGPRHRPA
jgi:hypothetical protein